MLHIIYNKQATYKVYSFGLWVHKVLKLYIVFVQHINNNIAPNYIPLLKSIIGSGQVYTYVQAILLYMPTQNLRLSCCMYMNNYSLRLEYRHTLFIILLLFQLSSVFGDH